MKIYEFGQWTLRYEWGTKLHSYEKGWQSGDPRELGLGEWGRIEYWLDGVCWHSFLVYSYTGLQPHPPELRIMSFPGAIPVCKDNYFEEEL